MPELPSIIQQSYSNVMRQIKPKNLLLLLHSKSSKIAWVCMKAQPVSIAGTYAYLMVVMTNIIMISIDGLWNVFRVCIVDSHGKVVLDTFVKPVGKVTNYLTDVSGIHEHHLVGAPSFRSVQQRVQ